MHFYIRAYRFKIPLYSTTAGRDKNGSLDKKKARTAPKFG